MMAFQPSFLSLEVLSWWRSHKRLSCKSGKMKSCVRNGIKILLYQSTKEIFWFTEIIMGYHCCPISIRYCQVYSITDSFHFGNKLWNIAKQVFKEISLQVNKYARSGIYWKSQNNINWCSKLYYSITKRPITATIGECCIKHS